MVPQQSGASQQRQRSLAPGTHHRYHLTSKDGYVQTVVKEFDGMALMVVDLNRTTHTEIRDRCRSKLRPGGGRIDGEILVVEGRPRLPLRLALFRYIDGRLQTEGALIETAGLGRVINIA